ncbi:MAG: stage II sporulation protein R [Clostridia bacterium]|nr:stage II sporulation protein R [Clostridia bacterium]
MKVFNISLCFGLIISIVLGLARFDALCQDLRDNLLRVHIVAASDSKDDQELKLKVRDELLLAQGSLFENCSNINEALTVANNNLSNIKGIAEKVVRENGFDYNVSVKIEEAYFGNREYESFTLPAGEYMAVNVIIGEGKGKNWWCVMFPAVCLGASSCISDAADENSAMVAENSERYQIRFKTVEIYEDLKKFFTKRKK